MKKKPESVTIRSHSASVFAGSRCFLFACVGARSRACNAFGGGGDALSASAAEAEDVNDAGRGDNGHPSSPTRCDLNELFPNCQIPLSNNQAVNRNANEVAVMGLF